jgi:hypothetical protein
MTISGFDFFSLVKFRFVADEDSNLHMSSDIYQRSVIHSVIQFGSNKR